MSEMLKKRSKLHSPVKDHAARWLLDTICDKIAIALPGPSEGESKADYYARVIHEGHYIGPEHQKTAAMDNGGSWYSGTDLAAEAWPNDSPGTARNRVSKYTGQMMGMPNESEKANFPAALWCVASGAYQNKRGDLRNRSNVYKVPIEVTLSVLMPVPSSAVEAARIGWDINTAWAAAEPKLVKEYIKKSIEGEVKKAAAGYRKHTGMLANTAVKTQSRAKWSAYHAGDAGQAEAQAFVKEYITHHRARQEAEMADAYANEPWWKPEHALNAQPAAGPLDIRPADTAPAVDDAATAELAAAKAAVEAERPAPIITREQPPANRVEVTTGPVFIPGLPHGLPGALGDTELEFERTARLRTFLGTEPRAEDARKYAFAITRGAGRDLHENDRDVLASDIAAMLPLSTDADWEQWVVQVWDVQMILDTMAGNPLDDTQTAIATQAATELRRRAAGQPRPNLAPPITREVTNAIAAYAANGTFAGEQAIATITEHVLAQGTADVAVPVLNALTSQHHIDVAAMLAAEGRYTASGSTEWIATLIATVAGGFVDHGRLTGTGMPKNAHLCWEAIRVNVGRATAALPIAA
ncbi:hypothetical protein [Actinoplanes sp. NPDC049802]|uniref:hypothetical protein n=1 Tax=Actinoplanes sp. NPDC049802 TaxID=3154742 RepID=UPI00340A91D2